jgi:hypothetical protein
MFVRCFLLLPLATLLTVPSAEAWGCKGHQIVALIAQQHLTGRAHAMSIKILTEAPVDVGLARSCPELGDGFVDASMWADDIRRVRPETGPWHFIDLPRGAPQSDLLKYCPPASGCVISALADELRVLGDPSRTPEARAEALRFAIHFVGDIHQPLHASTNNDLGGNCVPVEFFGRRPAPSSPGSAVFIPNLHQVWDVEIIERFSAGESPQTIARELDRRFSARMAAWQAEPTDFAAWAWESHELAERVVYGELPRRLPVETPRPITSCAARGDVGRRSVEDLAADYQKAASPVVEEQLAKAGARLAALLNFLWH